VAQERNAHAALAQLQDEITAVRQRPGSNLPPDFTQFRAQLAEQLRLAPDALPFVAELVEVPAAHQAWRGAIERALGAQRLRLLVPPQAMQAALAWVNQRHNRLHVRLLEVRAPASPARFWDDGFARLLTLKSHAHQGALRQLLAEQDQPLRGQHRGPADHAPRHDARGPDVRPRPAFRQAGPAPHRPGLDDRL
jgi:uncharacterized protein YPO0396